MKKDLLDLSCWGEEVASNLIRAMITQRKTIEIANSISPEVGECYRGSIEATQRSIIELFMSHPFWNPERGLFGYAEFWKEDVYMLN